MSRSVSECPHCHARYVAGSGYCRCWPAAAPELDVVGAPDIAEMIGVKLNTVHVWVKRDRADGKGRLPTPDALVSWTPIWWRSTITDWMTEQVAAGRATVRDLGPEADRIIA